MGDKHCCVCSQLCACNFNDESGEPLPCDVHGLICEHTCFPWDGDTEVKPTPPNTPAPPKGMLDPIHVANHSGFSLSEMRNTLAGEPKFTGLRVILEAYDSGEFGGWYVSLKGFQVWASALADKLEYRTTVQTVCVHCGSNIKDCHCFLAGVRRELRLVGKREGEKT